MTSGMKPTTPTSSSVEFSINFIHPSPWLVMTSVNFNSKFNFNFVFNSKLNLSLAQVSPSLFDLITFFGGTLDSDVTLQLYRGHYNMMHKFVGLAYTDNHIN